MGLLASLFKKNVTQKSNTINVGGSVSGSVNQGISIQNVIIDPASAVREVENSTDLQALLSSVAEATSRKHPLYPYYETAVRMNGNGAAMYSKPVIEEAKEKYPMRIKGEFSVENLNGYSFQELQKRAYISQEHIKLELKNAVRMLGDEIDPYQNGIEELLRSRFEMVPPELPGPFRVMLSVKGTTEFYDDLLMKVQPTNPDEHMLHLSNAGQDNALLFELKWYQESHDVTLNYRFKGKNWREINKFIKFMIAADKGSYLLLHNLEDNVDMLELPLNEPLYKEDRDYLKYDLELVTDIISVMDYFHININPELELSDDDKQMISLLAKSIRGEKSNFSWDSFSCQGKMKPAAMDMPVDSEFRLTFVSVIDISIQGEIIEGLTAEEELCCAKYASPSQMKEAMCKSIENDEIVKIDLIPGSEGNAATLIIKL